MKYRYSRFTGEDLPSDAPARVVESRAGQGLGPHLTVDGHPLTVH